jgi:MFS superfamily sulfate permease-like transporter
MIKNLFSYLDWPEGYNSQSLKTDILAGLTVALVLIPQSMAYAELAVLPSYYGLYASFLPPIVASFFGSSRQLATGPEIEVIILTRHGNEADRERCMKLGAFAEVIINRFANFS